MQLRAQVVRVGLEGSEERVEGGVLAYDMVLGSYRDGARRVITVPCAAQGRESAGRRISSQTSSGWNVAAVRESRGRARGKMQEA